MKLNSLFPLNLPFPQDNSAKCPVTEGLIVYGKSTIMYNSFVNFMRNKEYLKSIRQKVNTLYLIVNKTFKKKNYRNLIYKIV